MKLEIYDLKKESTKILLKPLIEEAEIW